MLFSAVLYALAAWLIAKRANKRQDEARELFEAPYITSWIFEKDSWETFAKCSFSHHATWVTVLVGRLLYRRHRRFQSHVHCCVLSRGSLYQMGNMLSLQPATSCTTAMMYNLLSVHLERKSVDEVLMNILTINLKTRGKNSDLAVTVMVPVPDVMTQRVMSCIPSFVEGYTTEYTINVEDIVPMSKKMEPVTIVHQVNVTKDDITM